MGTIVIVHGAGVREKGIAQLKQDIANGITDVDALSGLNLQMCEYGPNVGAKPDRVAETLPEEVVSKGLTDEPAEDEREAALWSLLFDDPLFELRVAATAAKPSKGGVVIAGDLPGEAIRETIDALKDLPDLPTAETGISRDEFLASMGTVTKSPELREAATAVGDPSDAELIAAVARSIVAQIISGHRHDAPGTHPPLVVNGEIRDRFVQVVASGLVPVTDRALGAEWLKKRLAAFIASRATVIAADHRAAAQEAASLVVADVLHYLRRPDEMVAFVRDCLAKADPPIIALGHSLGGIILVDVLSAADPPPVDLLVTVGSQSPILFAYDALARPRDGLAAQLPYATDRPPFTPWLNIYNRNDFVSFRAREIFCHALGADKLDIEDEELHLPEAFPAAHGAYWTDNGTFKYIGERAARLRVFSGGRP